MQRSSVIAVLAAVIAMSGCQQAPVDDSAWFDGSFDEALASAQSRGTMLMLDFYSPT